MVALRRLAHICEFINLDDYLLDRIVSGVRDECLNQWLIAKPELTFQMAFDEACAAELTNLSLADMPKGQSPPKPRESSIHYNEANPLDDSDEEE